jgi:hypothetical protein
VEPRAIRARDLMDTPTLYRASVMALANPKTVDRVLLGLPVRGDVETRIRAVLAEIGVKPLDSASAPGPEGQP